LLLLLLLRLLLLPWLPVSFLQVLAVLKAEGHASPGP
jgi:hypothetical protein